MAPSDASPFHIYGPLLAAVQMASIFGDGKTFVDALPKRGVDAIMADFVRLTDRSALNLRRFVDANFELPITDHSIPPTPATQSLAGYIRTTWQQLVREPQDPPAGSSALSVRHRHLVPGGRFRELYYWDSFFTILGLVRDGEFALAEGLVDAMTDLIERYGHVPNGTRTYYLGRSQPPLYHLMVGLIEERQPEHSARRLAAMKAEHAWWMAGEDDVAPGEASRRVAKLADGSVLNRYWDSRTTPRDESWREDVQIAAESARPEENVYRDLRAAAESGWDFSSRWLDDDPLSSIRTTAIAPIDLNAFLFSLERTIAAGGGCDADTYNERARRRLLAIHKHCWSAETGCFVDLDLERKLLREPTAASVTPLLCEIATPPQAAATADFVQRQLLAPGGLRTTLHVTGQQWDRPNGWAPLQWIAVQGLEAYGHCALARAIARRWLATVHEVYRSTGTIHEKYDVENCSVGGGGEYAPQIGFGWSNGVTRDFLERFG